MIWGCHQKWYLRTNVDLAVISLQIQTIEEANFQHIIKSLIQKYNVSFKQLS